jgi:hypothetical protein
VAGLREVPLTVVYKGCASMAIAPACCRLCVVRLELFCLHACDSHYVLILYQYVLWLMSQVGMLCCITRGVERVCGHGPRTNTS